MKKALEDIFIYGHGTEVLLVAYLITGMLVGTIVILYFGIHAYKEYLFLKELHEYEKTNSGHSDERPIE